MEIVQDPHALWRRSRVPTHSFQNRADLPPGVKNSELGTEVEVIFVWRVGLVHHLLYSELFNVAHPTVLVRPAVTPE